MVSAVNLMCMLIKGLLWHYTKVREVFQEEEEVYLDSHLAMAVCMSGGQPLLPLSSKFLLLFCKIWLACSSHFLRQCRTNQVAFTLASRKLF